MTIYYLPSTEGRDDPSADLTARELILLAGPDDNLLLPDDDAYDPLAVELAECGVRRVRLTLAERLAAATRILASGASVRSVCLRLGLPEGTEDKWHQLHKRAITVVSALVILAVAITAAVGTTHTRTTRPVHHVQAKSSRAYKRDRDYDPDDRKSA